jgi:hypothetical protein
LDAVSAALESARAGNPRIVLIEGEPGIGQTAFVHQFISRAADVTVLEASGEETEVALDYGVVGQLLAQAPPDPAWEALHEQLSAESPTSVFAVGAELLAMLGSLQDRAPVALLIDDVQWHFGDPAAARRRLARLLDLRVKPEVGDELAAGQKPVGVTDGGDERGGTDQVHARQVISR